MKPNLSSATNFLAGLRACGLAGLRACGLAVLLGLTPSIWAQTCTYFNAFKDNGDGTVTDPRSNTVWQRCHIGQSWSGAGCVGEGKEMPWSDAMKSAKTDRFLKQEDWRLPTKSEAESVVGVRSNCGSGFRSVSELLYGAAWRSELSTWTSSSHQIHANYVWYFSFLSGTVNSNLQSSSLTARLVRGGLPSSTDEFNREFLSAEVIDAAARRKEQLEREQAAAKAAAEARLERAAAMKTADAARKQREYENSPAGKAEKRKQEREAAVQAQRERAQAVAQQQQERAQAAANAANNAQACGRLYIGKPVTLQYAAYFGGQSTAEAIIIGVGNGIASARVIGGQLSPLMGIVNNYVFERSCNQF